MKIMRLYDYAFLFRVLDSIRIVSKRILCRLDLRDRQSCAYCGRDQWVVWHSNKWECLPSQWHNKSLCIECFCALFPGILVSDDIKVLVYNTNSNDKQPWAGFIKPINIMVTAYSESDLISFGKYLLSKEREDTLRQTSAENPSALSYEERFREVYDADLQNWKEVA